jgi:hypothetical protein
VIGSFEISLIPIDDLEKSSEDGIITKNLLTEEAL